MYFCFILKALLYFYSVLNTVQYNISFHNPGLGIHNHQHFSVFVFSKAPN